MNPEKTSREEIEAKLTALLLGELPAEEAQQLHSKISQDAALAQLHDRLKLTIGFVREIAANPADATPAQNAPLKLSDEKREKLLAHFKTIAPREFVPLVPPLKKRREISPLLAMAAAIALIAVLAAMLLPSLSAAKYKGLLGKKLESFSVQMAKEKPPTAPAVPNKPESLDVAGTSPSEAQPKLDDYEYVIVPSHMLDGGGRWVQKNDRTPAPPEVASVLNQEEENKARSSLAEIQNNPSLAQEGGTEQRVKSIEGYFQNGDPTAGRADDLKKQTAIVLPSDGTDNRELAAAGSAPAFEFGLGVQRNYEAEAPQTKLRAEFQNGGTAHNGSAATSVLESRAQQTFSTSSGTPDSGELTTSSAFTGKLDKSDDTTAQAAAANNPPPPASAPTFAFDSGNSGGGGFGGGMGGGGGAAAGGAARRAGRGGRGGGRGGGGAGGGGAPANVNGNQTELQTELADTTVSGHVSPSMNWQLGGQENSATPSSRQPQMQATKTEESSSGDTINFDDLAKQDGFNLDAARLAHNEVAGDVKFYRTQTAPEADAESAKSPMLGDIPLLGNQFQNGQANKGFYDDNISTADKWDSTTANNWSATAAAPKYDDIGKLALEKDLSKTGTGELTMTNLNSDFSGGVAINGALTESGAGTFALNGVNTYNGGTVVNNGTLTVVGSGTVQLPVSAANPLGQFPGNPAGVVADSSDSDQLITGGLNNNAPAQGENGSLGNLAYDNGGTVGSARISVDPDTHNLIVVADKETEDQIRKRLAELDSPSRQMLIDSRIVNVSPTNSSVGGILITEPALTVPQNTFQSRLLSQNQNVASSTPAPTAAPPASVVSAPSVLARKARLGVDVYDQGQAQSQPQLAFSLQATNATLNRSVNPSNVLIEQAIPEDRPLPKTPSPAPVPTPEMLTRENAFSTFSLNVSDVSFKLAAASLEKGQLPDAASIRSEEFINAFNYHDPEPAAGVPVAFVAERARDPFAHNRDLLRFSVKTAAAGREAGRPLNIVLLLDNSGSMERADRVAIIHEALKVLASQLQPQDTLSIVTFARTARLWVDGAHGDQAGTAVNKVSDLTPEGGTNLEEAMNLAYATARRHYLAKGDNRVVLLTDGAANLGNVNPEALKQKVESFRKQGIALDCFGIGWEGYNDDLLEVLSSNGDGRYGFINTPEAATTEFAAQLAGALHVAAEDVKVQVEFNPQRVISWRQIGYAKHQLTKEQFRDNTVAAAPMAAREAGNGLYTVEVNPQGTGPVATVRVRFRVPGTQEVSEHEWAVPFDGTAPALEQSSPAMRLAATSSAFSEWLAQSQFAQEVTTDQLLNYLNGVPAIYGADPRPKQLETMIREAKSLSGK